MTLGFYFFPAAAAGFEIFFLSFGLFFPLGTRILSWTRAAQTDKPHQKFQLHTVFHIIWWCITAAKPFFFLKTSQGKKKKTSYIRWKNFPPHKRDVVEGMKTKVPIRFYFNTRGRNTIICTNTKKMPARGALLITAALVGNISGETDVRDLLTKVFQTSAYNLKAIVNTAQKVNWAH